MFFNGKSDNTSLSISRLDYMGVLTPARKLPLAIGIGGID
jgi:hypothetical protein